MVPALNQEDHPYDTDSAGDLSLGVCSATDWLYGLGQSIYYHQASEVHVNQCK